MQFERDGVFREPIIADLGLPFDPTFVRRIERTWWTNGFAVEPPESAIPWGLNRFSVIRKHFPYELGWEPSLTELGIRYYESGEIIRWVESPWHDTDLGDDTSLPWNLNAFWRFCESV